MSEALRSNPTQRTVEWAVGTVKGELAGLRGASTRRWTVELTDHDGLIIRRLKNGATHRLIMASPKTEGSLIPEDRITVLDLETNNLINEGPKPRRILVNAVRQIFPDRTRLQDELARQL